MKTARAFTLRFWLCAIAAALACVLALPPRGGAPRPPFPLSMEAYLSSYRGESADHYLLGLGILGFGQRMRDSELLVFGSSHAQLGLSAAQLGKRAFNAGLGYGEGIAFFRDIVDRNDLSGKALLVDIYNWRGDGVSDIAAGVRQAGPVQGYVRVGKVWGRAVSDWLLDGLIPCAEYRDGEFTSVRCVDWLMLRRWTDGDMHEWWSPTLGALYRDVPPALTRRFAPQAAREAPVEYSGPFGRAFPPSFLAQRALKPVLTLVPYPAGDATWAATQAQKLGLPFATISPEGLEFTADRHHLTAAGRTEATRRLLR